MLLGKNFRLRRCSTATRIDRALNLVAEHGCWKERSRRWACAARVPNTACEFYQPQAPGATIFRLYRKAGTNWNTRWQFARCFLNRGLASSANLTAFNPLSIRQISLPGNPSTRWPRSQSLICYATFCVFRALLRTSAINLDFPSVYAR